MISRYEKGTRNVTDRTISDICREFNINEEWLRYGTGEIEIETDDSLLARVIEEYNVKDDITINIMKNFLEMDDKDRISLIEKAQQLLEVKKDIVNKTSKDTEFSKELNPSLRKYDTLSERSKNEVDQLIGTLVMEEEFVSTDETIKKPTKENYSTKISKKTTSHKKEA